MLPENVSSSRMYDSAVYRISQSNRRITTSVNIPDAATPPSSDASVSGVAKTPPPGTPDRISSYTSWSSAKNGSPPSGTTCEAPQNARCPPGRSTDAAFLYFTAGSIQCQAVAANTSPNDSSAGGCHVSKSVLTTVTCSNEARFRCAAAARAAPSSTHVIANPCRASGSVALPEAHPTSHSASASGRTPVSESSAEYSESGYSGRAS